MDFRPAGMSDEEETDYNGAINYSKNASARNINGPKVNGQMNEVEERKLFHKLAREACDSENVYMIDKFVNADNDVNAFLDSGWTLLLYASSAARPTMIKHLLGLGADPNKDKDGHTPLLALCNTIRNTPAQRLESLILLLEAGADSNFISRMKETPLMHACNSQEADFIAELVKSVNNINALDIEKRSALFYATIINRSDSVKVLLENGIDINQKDSRGMTCKDVAIAKGYEEIVAVLDECKPDEEEIVSFGTTKILSWRDLFSSLRHRDDVNIDIDILSILNGIGLEKISALFCGMQLKDFLRLTEEDLEKIGVDIGIHRQRFVEDIFKFHNQVWCIDTLGSYVDKRKSYTICSTIKSLGIVSKHVDVIAAGLCHVKSCLALREINKDLIITEESKVEYATEFHKLRYNLQKLKKELRILKKLTEQINKNNEITNPLYIGPETPTKKYRMSDYFDEMGWTPLRDGETPNHFLQLARFFRDFGAWELLEDREKLPPPASKNAVAELKETEITESKKQCPVCIREFNIGVTAKTLPCNHSFHKECIIPWLEKTNSCPLCRHELPTDDEDYENLKKEKKRAQEREKEIEALHNSMFS